MKDKVYFEKVVKKALKCKIEKGLVDKFLLGLDISEYGLPNRLGELNIFEISLLAWYYRSKGDLGSCYALKEYTDSFACKNYSKLMISKVHEIILSLNRLQKDKPI